MAKQSYMNTIKRNEGVNYSESTVSCPRTFSLPGRGLLRQSRQLPEQSLWQLTRKPESDYAW